jgi:hypothetical protein
MSVSPLFSFSLHNLFILFIFESFRYWMYAAVAAGPNALLVSNDEMRDHAFQLLAPRYFHKWKQRHQVKYTFGTAGLVEFTYPPPYTTCAQEVGGGAWVLPAAEGEGAWLCCSPHGGGEERIGVGENRNT